MSLRPTAKEFVPSTGVKVRKTRLSAKAASFIPGSSPTTLIDPRESQAPQVNGFGPKTRELNGTPKSDDVSSFEDSETKVEAVNGYPKGKSAKAESPSDHSKPPVKDRLRSTGPILPRNSKPIPVINSVDKEPLAKLSIPTTRTKSAEEEESLAEEALERSVKKYTRDEIMSLRKKAFTARETEIMAAISSVLKEAAAAITPKTYSPANAPRRLNHRGGKRDPPRRGRGGSHRGRGGGGRYQEEMDIEVKDLEKSENRYVIKKEVPPDEKLIRDLTAVLNKLTPEKFEKLLEIVEDMKIDTPNRLRDTVTAVFEKALSEPAFSPTYAEFSVALSARLKHVEDESETISFKRLLLNKCQQEFEKDVPRSPNSESETPNSEDPNDESMKAKRRMLATIQFIGELYARKMLNTSIMKQCIGVLLGKGESLEEEKLEALCKLLSTIGKTIDVAKNSEFVNEQFVTLKALSKKKDTISSRARFMIQDILDLRSDKWVDRRAKTVVQKKLSDFHKDDSRKESNTPRNRTPRGSERYVAQNSPRAAQNSPRARGGQTPRTPKGPSPVGDEEQWEVAGGKRKGREVPFSTARRSSWTATSKSRQSPRVVRPQETSSSKKEKSSRAPLSPGDRQKVSAGTANSFSVLDGDETEDSTPSRGDDSSPLSAQTPPQERKRLKLKKPSQPPSSSKGAFFPDKSVSQSTTPSGSRKPKDFDALDREKTETQMKGILEEYLNSEDLKEACLCTNELNEKLPKDDKEVGLQLLVVQGLNLGVDKREKDQNLLNQLFVHMYEEKILSADDFAAGLKDALEFADDMAIDCPKLYDYFASLFAKLVVIEAISLAYLATPATEPLKEESKEKFVILTLQAIKNEAPDKLVTLYKESGLELSSLLKPSTSMEDLLEDQDLSSLISAAS